MLEFFHTCNKVLWGPPILILLLGTHCFFTLRLQFVQKKILPAIRLSFHPSAKNSDGVSGFTALSTSLAATLGTGNIIGVSSAIALGGPGAVFWCWLTGIGGMATSYAECYLSMLFRKKNKDGSYQGGPMYVLEYGLHKKWLGKFYSFCTLMASFGVGCTTQANAITETTTSLWGFSPSIVGIVFAVLAGFILIGGISSIGKVCEKLVPFMGLFYIAGCLLLLYMNHSYLLPSLELILKGAFCKTSIAGGLLGGSFLCAARYGIARGLFTNEAGLGSTAIAAAAANTKEAKEQALISMTATFWDTVVMCLLTGIVIVSTIVRYPNSIIHHSPTQLTSVAFSCIPYGETILGISLIAFAFATIIGWSYFGEQAVLHLFGERGKPLYHFFYVLMIFFGGISSLDLVWELADFINIFMAFPNVFALFALYKKIEA